MDDASEAVANAIELAFDTSDTLPPITFTGAERDHLASVILATLRPLIVAEVVELARQEAAEYRAMKASLSERDAAYRTGQADALIFFADQIPAAAIREAEIAGSDDRPIAEPDCLSFYPEGEGAWVSEAQDESVKIWRGKCQEGRWTIVNDEYPNPPYPHGLYFEGWSVAPHRMDPPHKAAEFNYPLVAMDPKG